MTRAWGRLLAVLMVLASMVVAGSAAGRPVFPRPKPHPAHLAQPAQQLQRAGSLQVGQLTLHPCAVLAGTWCGSVRRNWEPGNPAAGKITVGFAFLPAGDDSQPAIGTLVPHEGGPGYSTTGSAGGYQRMYRPLLDRRNMLLVDQRGTGRSEAIDCPALQNLKIRYSVAAQRCGHKLGRHADDYTSALSADDLAAVIKKLGLGQVDLYGDSYGTFFQQVFAGRHGDLIRSIVLDSAYPTYGETGWYPTQGPAMRRAFDIACSRSPECDNAGAPFLSVLDDVLAQVRHDPWRGVAYDADGRRMHVAVNPKNLVTLMFGATYAPAFYREVTAAMRSALSGYRAPLLRLIAEATGGGTNAGPIRAYSEGNDAAVSCHDYPQLYDMTAPPGAVRETQYHRALDRREQNQPNTYAPFTVHEYARSDWEALSWCTRWPTAPASNPAGPPVPPSGYPNVPVLVLSGELDSITTPREGQIVKDQFPNARQVVLANSFHVNASYDYEGCGQSLVRAFVQNPSGSLPGCAPDVQPVRTMGLFPRTLSDVPPGHSDDPVGTGRLRTAPAAALVVADLMDRWWNNYSGHDVGLHGGRMSYVGYVNVRFHLHHFELINGHKVSGTAAWDRSGKTVVVDLRLTGRGLDGRLRGTWDTRAEGATAVLHGHLGGEHVRIDFPAP